MVKGQYGMRLHQQPKGGGGEGQHHQQTCEHFGKFGNVKNDCWYVKNGQLPSGIGKGKSSQGGKGKGKNKKRQDPPRVLQVPQDRPREE